MSTLTETIIELEQLEKRLKGMSGVSQEYNAALQKAISATLNRNKALVDGIGRSSRAYKDCKDNIKNLVKEMAALKAQEREVSEIQQKLEKSAERMSKGYEGWLDTTKKVSDNIKQVIGAVGKYTAILGVEGLALKTSNDRYQKYSQSLFNLARVQQISGRGTKDFTEAFKRAGKQALLSKDQFAQLASEVGNLTVGLAPAATEIADIAGVMREKYGPDTDLVIAKTKEFYSIQQKWPSLVNKVQAALKGMGGENRILALMMGDVADMSSQELKSMDQMMAPVAAGQADMVKWNTQSAKTAMEWRDAQIAAIDAVQGALIGLSKAAEFAAKKIQAAPKVAGGAMLGGAGLDIASAAGGGVFTALLLRKLGGGKGLKGGMLMGRGAAAAASGSPPAMAGGPRGTYGEIGGADVYQQAMARNLPKASATKGIGSTIGKGAATAGRFAGRAIPIAGAAMLGWEAGKGSDWVTEAITGKSISSRVGETFGGALSKPMSTEDYRGVKKGQRAKLERHQFEKETQGQKSVTQETKESLKIDQQRLKEKKRIEDATAQEIIKIKEVITDQQAWLEALGKGTSAYSGLVDMGEQLSMANVEAAESSTKIFEATTSIAKANADNVLKLVEQEMKYHQISAVVKRTGNYEKDMRDTSRNINALLKEGVKDDTKRNALLLMQTQIAKQMAQIQKENVERVNAMVRQLTTELNVSKGLNDIYEDRLNTERQLLETAMFGLGASVEMMQKQVDLLQRRKEANDEMIAKMDDYFKTEKKLTDNDIEALKNARSDIELKQVALDIAKEHNIEAEDLIANAKEYQKVTTDSMKQQQKILEITKQVREGYLSAMKQSAFGFGQFAKIIGTQTRGVSQLMRLVKGARGMDVLNTMAVGGLQAREATKAGLGTEAAYRYTTTGVEKGITRSEEASRLNRIWKYEETNRMARGARVGTGVGASAADIAVMKERGAAITGGGRTVITPRGMSPDLTRGMMSAVTKGSQMRPGDTLPSQQGIPSNYAGGAGIVPMSAALMKGSSGQVASATGGPALTPTPLKGATQGAYASEWMKPLIDKQAETNTNLQNILNKLDSGIAVNAMNGF